MVGDLEKGVVRETNVRGGATSGVFSVFYKKKEMKCPGAGFAGASKKPVWVPAEPVPSSGECRCKEEDGYLAGQTCFLGANPAPRHESVVGRHKWVQA